MFADVLRFRRKENDPNGRYLHIVRIRSSDTSEVHIECTNFTGAMILMDVINRVLSAPSIRGESSHARITTVSTEKTDTAGKTEKAIGPQGSTEAPTKEKGSDRADEDVRG